VWGAVRTALEQALAVSSRDQRAAALVLLAMEGQGMTLQEGRKIRNDTNARSTIPPELVMETVRPSWRSS